MSDSGLGWRADCTSRGTLASLRSHPAWGKPVAKTCASPIDLYVAAGQLWLSRSAARSEELAAGYLHNQPSHAFLGSDIPCIFFGPYLAKVLPSFLSVSFDVSSIRSLTVS